MIMIGREEIVRTAELLCEAEYAIALTGAGISTPSGIPDFRTPDSGLWEKENPLEVASIFAFRHHPRAFYDWIRPLAKRMIAAQPNPGHKALAKMEQAGCLQAIITQNIDGLHQEAGSEEVLEIHGHAREATCMDRHCSFSATDLLEDLLATERLPHCPNCDGILKPDVVLFGEQLPEDVFAAAMQHIQQADLMLVAGSSLEVAPVSRFPMDVYRNTGHLIVVNLTPTYVDDVADVVIHDDVAEALPHVAKLCTKKKRTEKNRGEDL